MSTGKVGDAFRVFVPVRDGAGNPLAGVDPGDFTTIVLNPARTSSELPTMIAEGFGIYSFAISAGFSATHGVGNYGFFVQVASAVPFANDFKGGTVKFEASGFDDLAQPGDAMDLVADAVDTTSVATDAIDADALATDAVNEIRDSILADSTPFDGADIAATLAAVGALNDLNQADVQAALTAQGYTTLRAAELSEILDHLKNRMEWDFSGGDKVLILYDRAGTTELHRWTMTTDGGEAVSPQFSVQTKRSTPV